MYEVTHLPLCRVRTLFIELFYFILRDKDNLHLRSLPELSRISVRYKGGYFK